jgi:rod shape-determining protein MreD
MSLPLAAAGAITLALIELSVVPYLVPPDLTPDLVLVAVIPIAAFFGLERALAWAFVGGLMLDLLSAGPYRPLGATAFTLLILAGLTAAAARLVPGGRVPLTVALVAVTAVVYHLAVLFFISLRGVSVAEPLATIAPLALVDAILAVPVAVGSVFLVRRAERQEGLGW